MSKAVRFHYLYRDSGNYKKFGYKDFSNPTNLSLESIEQDLKNNLISGEFFYPEEVGITKFRFHRYCDDHSWYEIEFVELITNAYCRENISDFIEKLKMTRD